MESQIDKYFNVNGDNNQCITKSMKIDELLIMQTALINEAYRNGTQESVADAIKKEIPKLNDILIDFSETMCGRAVFNSSTIDRLRKANEILQDCEVNVTKNYAGRVIVYLEHKNGKKIDLTGGIAIMDAHIE